MVTLRLFDVEHDCEAVAAIRRAVQPFPITADDVRTGWEVMMANPVNRIQRLVAEDERGNVVGVCACGYHEGSPEGEFGINVNVLPGYRGRGVGTLLHDAGLKYVRENGAREVMAHIRGAEPANWAWAERRGYVLARERTESVLDLKGWDGARFAPDLDRVRQSGIRLVTLDRESIEPYWLELYDLDKSTVNDIPGLENQRRPAFEHWLREQRSDSAPMAYALALDGNRIAGGSLAQLPRQPGEEAVTEYTAVRREYRGRAIALAVKLLTVEAAVRAGATAMRTQNDPDNPAILRVNEKLGYRMVPGPRKYRLLLAAR